MQTLAQIAIASALGAALLLIVGGFGHVRRARAFAEVLARQQLVPHGLRRAVATIIGPAEVVLGGTAVAAWLGASQRAAPALAMIAGCYAVFGCYTAVVLVRAPGAPCGCFGADEPVTPLVAARAWVMAGVAGVAAVAVSAIPPTPLSARPWLLAPAVLVASAGWLVPKVPGSDLDPVPVDDSTFDRPTGVVTSVSMSRGSEPDAPSTSV